MDLSQTLKDLAISQSGFVFDPTSGVTFTVNTTGQFILLKLREGAGLEAVERALGDEFELGELDDPARDVREFLSLLRDQGVIPRASLDAIAPIAGDR